MRKSHKRIYLVLFLVGYFTIAYTVMHHLGITCVFLELFQFPCPGCGMTRAARALLRLDFYNAAKHNILIFFMPYIFLFVLFDFKHKIHKKILVGIAIVAMINWIFQLITYL